MGWCCRMNWLQLYLSQSVRRNLCTKVMCTTCGVPSMTVSSPSRCCRTTGGRHRSLSAVHDATSAATAAVFGGLNSRSQTLSCELCGVTFDPPHCSEDDAPEEPEDDDWAQHQGPQSDGIDAARNQSMNHNFRGYEAGGSPARLMSLFGCRLGAEISFHAPAC